MIIYTQPHNVINSKHFPEYRVPYPSGSDVLFHRQSSQPELHHDLIPSVDQSHSCNFSSEKSRFCAVDSFGPRVGPL